jgi:ribosomal protein L37AE/L43A
MCYKNYICPECGCPDVHQVDDYYFECLGCGFIAEGEVFL